MISVSTKQDKRVCFEKLTVVMYLDYLLWIELKLKVKEKL